MSRPSAFLILFSLMLAIGWVPAVEAAPAQAGPFVLNVRSQATRDGYVRESGENTNMGGITIAYGNFALGDNDLDEQFRAVLSFNTAGLPDNATITTVKLKVKTNGTVVGSDPFTPFGSVIVDIRRGAFGSSLSLESVDWQAARHAKAGYIYNNSVNGWYTSVFSIAAFTYINLTGTTQIRLRHQIQDNDDLAADVRYFWAGDAATAANRPLLTVTYTTP